MRNQKGVVFFERKDGLYWAYVMLEFSDWERYLIFNSGFTTKESAIKKVLEWKSTLKDHEIYVDISRIPSGYTRRDKAIIYFRKNGDLWQVKFLFKYGNVWHYVFLSDKTMIEDEARLFAQTWAANNHAAYELYISEEVFYYES